MERTPKGIKWTLSIMLEDLDLAEDKAQLLHKHEHYKGEI
jgi:hypothetical protein